MAELIVEIVEADLDRDDHQRHVLALTVAYALDPMGNAGPLADEVLERLIPGLKSHPTTLVFLAYVAGRPAGIATCFLGFSTFKAQPLINIHDLSVLAEHRGQGVGQELLAAVERKARELGCCKLTLEVLEQNTRARRVYETVGFVSPNGPVDSGGSLYMAKVL